MNRQLLAFVLALIVAVSLAACGDEPAGDGAATPAAPSSEAATPTDAPTAPASPAGPAEEAAALYSANCAGCHGPSGGGGSAPAIAGEDDPDSIREQIREGGDGMPGFSGSLSAAQIDALSQFVADKLR
ncbi:MAG: cytochrome c [Actinobacteria bacterium]|nr:cytochrome c [Actinomycetota bacterium]